MGVGNQRITQPHDEHVELHLKSVLRRFIQNRDERSRGIIVTAGLIPNYSGKIHTNLEKMNGFRKNRKTVLQFLESRMEGDLNVAAQK